MPPWWGTGNGLQRWFGKADLSVCGKSKLCCCILRLECKALPKREKNRRSIPAQRPINRGRWLLWSCAAAMHLIVIVHAKYTFLVYNFTPFHARFRINITVSKCRPELQDDACTL